MNLIYEPFEIVREHPPMWEDVNKVFDLTGKQPIFAYGDRVYNPFGVKIPEDLLVHEAVHLEQQGRTEIGAKLWWIRYLADPMFLAQQEAEAYHAQWKYVCSLSKDRNKHFKYLHLCAEQLSSPMYGSPVSYQIAMEMIKNPKKNQHD